MSFSFDCRKNTAVILPSLDPDNKFDKVIEGLIGSGFEHIVIVDDGSAKENKDHFVKASSNKQCTVLTHEVNKGKGRALKDAFDYVNRNMCDVAGVITIDGDGQHLIGDIIACGDRMLEEKDAVILGCRNFDLPNIPSRSVTGNKLTSKLFRLFFGITLSDTQTGLRAIPAGYLPEFCEIEGERFEYETNMLLNMQRLGIRSVEQQIATVYDPEDYSSHYNAVKDSARILKVMLKYLSTGSGIRYIISSVLSWILDNGLYTLLFSLLSAAVIPTAASGIAQVSARIVSSLFNFNMNDLFVFKGRENYWKAMWKYYCLCIPQTLVSTLCLTALVSAISLSSPFAAVIIKILVDLLLFIISFFIQKKWVFKK